MALVQGELFEQPKTKNCVRCGIRCRVVDKKNSAANLFVLGDMRTGRFCVNCLIADFLINCEIGPASAMGKEFMQGSKTPPKHWIKSLDGPWENAKKFDPEGLRLPHIQKQMEKIISLARVEYGAELSPETVDWDEVIANWNLPFQEKAYRKGRGGRLVGGLP